MRSNDLSK